ncbi:CBS domain pair protein [Synechococcus sp. PCC 7335]|uniref:CBS domain-containing protein n=1 Tax=Synechococcus sp. (strain ATCC 29403 / PCC 7335) TaxID=91464 RepID=UPI00017EE102|nr:CBS domain-containing protein [Synechococcus sp. PCC 7335]EDX82902.1 CBS domain pair protein [Synechococcus sp. PCC 7335]
MLTVRDIMTRPVVVIRDTASVANAIWLMRVKRVRSLIVEKSYKGPPCGILTEKDIVYNVIAKGDNPGFVLVGDIMRHPCIQLSVDATLQEAAQLLSDTGVHRAPVVQHGELLGIVSVTDILDKGSLPAPPHDELSRRIRDALQHARIIDDDEASIQQECDIAWQVLEDMKKGSTVSA